MLKRNMHFRTSVMDEKLCFLQVYIQYMKFARRSNGIKAARSIFKKAREDPRTGHQVH